MVWGKNKPNSAAKTMYAAKPSHPEVGLLGGQPQAQFSKEWSSFMGGLSKGMSGDHPKIDNGQGSKRTIYANNELRYDREKQCYSYGHPQDNFQNYSVQANIGASNNYLQALAKGGNGSRRAPEIRKVGHYPTFGGSTVASVNLQQPVPPSPKRVAYAINHSAYHAEPLYIVNKQTNIASIPPEIRQSDGIYHSNPFEKWPERDQPGNPYHGRIDPAVPVEGNYYIIDGVTYLYLNGRYRVVARAPADEDT
jgi:hypothetical protein